MNADWRGHFTWRADGQGKAQAGAKVAVFVLALLAAQAVAGLLPLPAGPGPWASAGAALAASWLCLRLEGEPLRSIGLRPSARFLSEAALGFALGASVILASALVAWLLGGFVLARGARVGLGGLLWGLVSFLAVAIYEELLFRGYAFQRAARGLGKAPATALFCLLFVAAHWGNQGMAGPALPLACLNIGLASLLLCLAFFRTDSLAAPIGIHLGWNWAQGPLLGFGVSGAEQRGYWAPVLGDSPWWLTGGDFGLEAGLPCAVACSAVCLALVLLGGRKGLGYNPGGRGAPRGAE
jgi:membrane protease YdiL (CAAX protease family)